MGALYSDLRDTALVVRALCHFRSRFLGAVRPVLSNPNIESGFDRTPFAFCSQSRQPVSAISGILLAISDASNSRLIFCLRSSCSRVPIGCHSGFDLPRASALTAVISIKDSAGVSARVGTESSRGSDARAMIPLNRPSGNPNCSHSRVPIPTWLRLLLFLHLYCRDSH